MTTFLKLNLIFCSVIQAAYDEDDKTRKGKESDIDYHDTLFVESIEQKPLDIVNEPENRDENVSEEVEVEEFALLSVKKSTNHKVFKGNNRDSEKRLTRSADLKKTSTSPSAKLPVLTKVNIQNVPKGITITKKTVAASAKPAAEVTAKPDTESNSKKITPDTSPESKPSGSQKLVVKAKPAAKNASPKSSAAANAAKEPDVQRVKLTKAQVAAMAKEGKIAVKDGKVFLRNGSNKSPK